ncbi:hypothetical protein CBL_07171 [Carabus blaptoides fortunei]
MTSRDRDQGRKYVGGAEKERKRKSKEEFISSLKGSMTKYLKKEYIQKPEKDSENEKTLNVSKEKSDDLPEYDAQVLVNCTMTSALQSTDLPPHIDTADPVVHDDMKNEKEDSNTNRDLPQMQDPGLWPAKLNSGYRNYLLEKVILKQSAFGTKQGHEFRQSPP